MKLAAFIAGVALAASVAQAGEVGRFRPATPDYVVLRVPASASNDPIAILERRHAQEPANESLASELAQLYLTRARAERELRYFARAEALVQPWAASETARASTLKVQADVLQYRHDFSGALELLDRAVALDPRDAGARLMRASVKLVQGRAADARPDCARVLAGGESATGTICLAQVIGATGGLQRADELLKSLLLRDQGPPGAGTSSVLGLATPTRPEGMLSPSVRAWALWLLADFSDRSGDPHAAEMSLRAAVEAAPENEGIRSALGDLLLARGAHREALAMVDLRAPSVGLLARRARAEQLLRDPALVETSSQIHDLLTLSSRRGDRPHLREEALIALDVEHDAARALDLAKANFETQRETIDVRLLVRAARANADNASLRAVAKWMHETGYEDHELAGVGT